MNLYWIQTQQTWRLVGKDCFSLPLNSEGLTLSIQDWTQDVTMHENPDWDLPWIPPNFPWEMQKEFQ
jgi:hypothetical protein